MILVLGGTGEARALAGALVRTGVPVTSSLAGRVSRPRLPDGAVRIGGFGGAAGLARWLAAHRVAAVVDATHPFAERISSSAAAACAAVDIPLLRLSRAGWSAQPDDVWMWAADTAAAARAVDAGPFARVFLTTGRQGLDAFAAVRAFCVIRCVEPPDPPLPTAHRLLLARGPYTVDGEGALLDAERIDVLVSKDSGGELTAAKLTAARQRGIPCIIIRRPAEPAGASTVADVDAAVRWARAHAG